MTTTNSDPVQDYILVSEDKFRIASEVSAAWLKVRGSLVSNFLGRLQGVLKGKGELEDWKFDPWGEPFADSEAGLSFWKPEWDYDYYVSLQMRHYGHLVEFGLGRDWDQPRIKKRPRSDGLLGAIRKHYPRAGARQWWEACIRMPPPDDDWENWDVLWRMQDENSGFLKKVAADLLKVATISARFVDELVAKK